MTYHEALHTFHRTCLLSGLFLLLTAQMALTFAVFRDGRSHRFKGAMLLCFGIDMLPVYMAFCDIMLHHDFPMGPEHPRCLEAFLSMPVSVVVACAMAAALLAVLALRNHLRYRQAHLTPGSVREAMDLLPVGIAYGREEGAVLLRNLVMDGISRDLIGKGLNDLNAFREAAGKREQVQVSAQGRVWQIQARRTEAVPSPQIQLTATDITRQAGVTAELEAKNRKLKDIQLRLQLYNRQAERLIIAQEMLTARMTVHDELGHVLLESRRCLTDPASIDRKLLLQALKNANTYLLREYEQDDTARDALADAIDMAESIGVEVTIAGAIPSEEPWRGVLAVAIQECAANAVKHAGGDALQTQIDREGRGWRFTLRTNGQPPQAPIREAGGLKSLRALTESKGGTMDVVCLPEFQLTITL